MIAEISGQAFDSFFALAPWVVGLIIYGAFFFAKRHERASNPAPPRQTYACAVCGRRGSIDQMVPQHHAGAVGYECTQCAASAQATAH